MLASCLTAGEIAPRTLAKLDRAQAGKLCTQAGAAVELHTVPQPPMVGAVQPEAEQYLVAAQLTKLQQQQPAATSDPEPMQIDVPGQVHEHGVAQQQQPTPTPYPDPQQVHVLAQADDHAVQQLPSETNAVQHAQVTQPGITHPLRSTEQDWHLQQAVSQQQQQQQQATMLQSAQITEAGVPLLLPGHLHQQQTVIQQPAPYSVQSVQPDAFLQHTAQDPDQHPADSQQEKATALQSVQSIGRSAAQQPTESQQQHLQVVQADAHPQEHTPLSQADQMPQADAQSHQYAPPSQLGQGLPADVHLQQLVSSSEVGQMPLSAQQASTDRSDADPQLQHEAAQPPVSVQAVSRGTDQHQAAQQLDVNPTSVIQAAAPHALADAYSVPVPFAAATADPGGTAAGQSQGVVASTEAVVPVQAPVLSVAEAALSQGLGLPAVGVSSSLPHAVSRAQVATVLSDHNSAAPVAPSPTDMPLPVHTTADAVHPMLPMSVANAPDAVF